MGVATHAYELAALAPILRTLDAVRARHGEPPVHGVARDLIVPDGGDWLSAGQFTDGSALPPLLAAARRRWPGDPHVAGALAWKSYAYWATLPAVVGYASTRRIPNMAADNVRVRIHGEAPFVELGMARAEVTALVGDPLAGRPGVRTVASDADLLTELRASLIDRHLDPVLDQLHTTVRVGRRTLLGSVASAVCYALLRANDVLPGSPVATASSILDALSLSDLVDFGPDATGLLTVTRKTCCLAFALSEPKVCSGCCIPAGRLINH
jgi:hypothetical protein